MGPTSADPSSDGIARDRDTGPSQGRALLGVGALVGVALVVLASLPIGAEAVLLALLVFLWVFSRPPRRRFWVGGIGLGLTLALTVAVWLQQTVTAPSAPGDAWTADAERAYVRLCNELLGAADSAAGALGRFGTEEAPRLEIFRFLQDLAEGGAFHGRTLIFLDPDGEAVAWAGEGLIHEPDAFDVPSSGLAFLRSYSALTLYAVAPISQARRPNRVMVGQSFPTTGVSFLGARRDPGEAFVWSLEKAQTGDGGEAAAAAGREVVARIAPEGMPVLSVARRSGAEETARRFSRRWWNDLARPGAAVVLGLTLLALAFLRGAVPGRSGSVASAAPVVATAVLAMSGLGVATGAFDLGPVLRIALVAGTGLALWGLLRPRASSVENAGGEVLGGLGLAGLAVLAWIFQDRYVSPDLAADLGGNVEHWVLRLAMGLLSLGLLTCASWTRGPAQGDAAAWITLVFLVLAAAVHDRPLAALLALALGGAAAGRWLRSIDLVTRPMALVGVLLLATASGAIAWEIAYRDVFRQRLPEDFLPLIAPPLLEEVNDLHVEIHEFFEGFELRRVMPPGEGPVDPDDLAFVLWNDSPLPQRDGVSALVVTLADGGRSSFSFGLSVTRHFQVLLEADRVPIPDVEAWTEASILGEADLLLDGEPWGVAEYWFLPRPGFRLEVDETAELDEALLRSETHRDAVDGLPRPVLFGMYSADGRAISSPWEESPPLAEVIRESPPGSVSQGSVDTPSGRSWYWAAEHDGVTEVLYLPQLSPIAGLERVGTHMLTSLAAVAILILWFLGVVLGLADVRGLVGQAVHSYSMRLLLIYVGLLLVPLVALNLVLLRSFEDRLRREQQTQGEASLASARYFLLDFLQGLQPGVSIDTQIDRGLLDWIANTVRHQVTFYWRGQFFASSQQELFTAGLLPRRIPGEVYARLALLGQEVERRDQMTRSRQSDLAYIELYTLLEDFGGASQGFFLSLPLVEQEEEVARELAALRRRAVLVTAGLVFLLLAVGSRLAASFTKPIMELIEGTREIASGAPFLGVAPRDRELSALGDAIDEMAQKIAEGRRKLMLEKRVVERMVENITSGVVSLDHARRVLLHNRVAAALLGTEVGVDIDAVLRRDAKLLPVADFLSRLGGEDGGEIRSETVELAHAPSELREWTLTWVPVPGPEDPAALLVVDDDTEVLRGQRLEAWAEMARIIAHEIKNPLTPIRLSAEHMRNVYHTDPERLDEVFERCTDNILKQVEELRDIASDFSIYSRIPRAELVEGDLVATMRDLTEAYRDTTSGGIDLGFHSELGELRVRFDEKLLGRAVRNLLENALRASAGTAARAAGNGGEEGARVRLSVEERDSKAVITVEDSGPGVDPDNLSRIFDPYFSTHETGTGLGLAISQRIVGEHGGRLEARNRTGGGLAVMITIPIPEPV